MKITADIHIVPIGNGVSLSTEIAQCGKILREAGLKTQLHAYGTSVEGDWDAVFAAVKKCHQSLHDSGTQRISTSIKVGSRTDKDESLEGRIQSVDSKS